MKRFKLFSQLETTDCGPACLQMVCNFWGRYLPQKFIKEGISISRIGVTVNDIIRRARELCLEAVAVKAPVAKLGNEILPAILHWRNIHFVVLYKISVDGKGGRKFHIADPSNGKIVFSEEEFKNNWLREDKDGIAILLRPNEDFYKQKILKERTDWTSVKKIIKKI